MTTRIATIEEYPKALYAPIVYKVAHIDSEKEGQYSSTYAGQIKLWDYQNGRTFSHILPGGWEMLLYKVGMVTKAKVGTIFTYPNIESARKHFTGGYTSALPLAILECRQFSPDELLVVKQIERLPHEPPALVEEWVDITSQLTTRLHYNYPQTGCFVELLDEGMVVGCSGTTGSDPRVDSTQGYKVERLDEQPRLFRVLKRK